MGVSRGAAPGVGGTIEHTVVMVSLALVFACDGAGDSGTTAGETGSEAGTAASSSTTSDGSTSAGATSESTTGSGTSGTVTSTSSDGSTGDSSDTQVSTTTPTTDSGGHMPVSCSLEDLDPMADPAAVLDYGDGAGQIPALVGEVLLRSCGCHYTDNVMGVVDYSFDNAQQLSTLAEFQANFLGTVPFNYNDRPTYEAVEQRVIFENPIPMPSFECAVTGTEPPVGVTDEDKAILQAWFDADAPDGATFVYP